MSGNAETIAPRALAAWVDWVRRLAWLVLALALLSSAGLLTYTARTIGMNAETNDMLSEKLDYRRHDAEMDRAFPKNIRNFALVVEGPSPEAAEEGADRLVARVAEHRERFPLVFFAQTHPFFRQNGLLFLDLDELVVLSDRLAEAQPMLAILNEDGSLRGMARVLELAIEQSEADVAAALARVLDRLADTVEALAEGRPAQLSWRSIMTDEEVTDSDRRAFALVKPVLDYDSLEPAAPAISIIEQEAEALGLTQENGYRVRVLGSQVLLQDELRSVREGMGLVGVLSLVTVLVLLTLGLGSWRLVLATLVTLLVGLIWTAAFAAAAIGSLNLISVAFAVLFIGLSVDFGIHFNLRYREARNGGEDHGAALQRAARGVGGALTLSAVTAAIGFLSFLPTAYKGVSELGLISGAGMFIALFANLTLLPALLTLLRAGPGGTAGGGTLAARFEGFVERRARLVLGLALGLALAAAAALPFAWFDDDPFNLRDPDSPSMQDLLAVLEDPRVQPYDAELLTESLERAGEAAARLEALPEVEEALTLLDFVPGEQDEKLEVIDEMSLFLGPLLLPVEPLPAPDEAGRAAALAEIERLAATAEGTLAEPGARLAAALAGLPRDAASLERVERAWIAGLPGVLERMAQSVGAEPVALEDLPAPMAERYLAPDGRARVEIIPSEDLRDAAARQRFVDAVLPLAPATVGTPISITAGGRAVKQAFGEAGAYALAAIVVLLLVLLRSWRDCLLILAPLLLATLLTVAATVVLGTPFNFANVSVLPLLFGLGVAFGIQFVLRARREQAGRLLRTSTPRAIAFSALTTIGSFCSLSLSSHPGTASMGFLLTVAIGLTLLCTLLVLPALLHVVDGRAATPSKAPRR